MASVWIARLRGKHGFQKLIAIKTILPQFASDPRFQKMFLDEAHIAAGIEHVNVAQILDLGEEHDVLYLVMEFVDGDSMSKLLRATDKKGIKIPPGIVLRLLADACAGLHAAHELRGRDGTPLGVVHRDVSPQNILVTNEGFAKVIDFGIAKARDRVAGDTGAGLLKGKVHYMPPEQAVGKIVDRRADVWAIGAIAYHLLSGKTAFDAPNQLATLHLLTSGKPPLPLPSTVHPSIAHVVRAAMSFDKEKRIPTCAALKKALEEAMSEADLVTTTDDVAAFLAEHLSDRKKQRQQAIELALKAAADRADVEKRLAPPPADTSSGLVGIDVKVQAKLEEARLAAVASVKTVAAKNIHDSSPGSPSVTDGSAPGSRSVTGAQPFETSNATLGSAAIETGAFPSMPPQSRRKKTMIAGAIVAACALVGLIAIVVAFTRKSSSDEHTAAAGGTTTTTATVGSSVTTTTTGTTTATAAVVASASATTDGAAPAASSAEIAMAPTTKPTTIKAPTVTTKPTTTTTTTVKKKKKKDDGF
jgi:eukaryotic-like serine/threonine-protein kinase